MAENEPIKYSDLISPDDSLEKLVKQLDDISSALQLVQKSAVSLNESMKTMSGATSEGRGAIAEASKEAEKLAKAQQDLEMSASETAKEIARLKDLQHLQNMVNKEAAKLSRSQAGSYNDLSVKYAQLKRVMNEMNPTTRKGRKEFKEMQKEAKRLHDEMNKLQQATGNFSLNVGNYADSIASLGGPIGGLARNFQSVTKAAMAFIATPIGAIVGALTAAFMALKSALNATEGGQQKLAKVTGFLKGTMNGLIEVVVQAGEVLVDVFTGNWKHLSQSAKEVKDAFLNIGNVATESARIAEAEKKLEQSMNAFQKTKSELNLERAKLERESRNMQNDAATRQKALDGMLKVDEKLYQAERAYLQEQIKLLGEKQSLTSNNTEDNKEMYALQAQLNDLEAEYIRKQMQSDKIQTRIFNQEKTNLKEIEAQKKKEDEEEKRRIKELEEQRKKADEERKKREQEEIKRRNEIFSAEKALSDYWNETTLSEEQKKKASVFTAILEQEEKALAALDKLADNGVEVTNEMYQEVFDNTKKQIEKADKELEKDDKELEKDGRAKSIYSLLGFDLKSEQEQAINAAFSSAISSVNSYIDSLVALKQQAVDTANARVDSAQKALDAEIEARNAGYANSVETAQKELQLAKQQQQKAEQEAKKAQKIQQQLDTLQQTASLVTATANIWKAFTGIEGGAGIPLAMAATATMWGAFAAAKIKAAQVTKGTEKYGEGTVELLSGGSHASGNDIDLGIKTDGTRRRAEGGEFFAVINKRNSRKYRKVIPDVIRSINNDTFASKYLNANGKMAGALINIQNTNSTDLRQLQDDVRAIKKANEQRTYIDGRGFLVTVNGQNKRIVKR